jgi:hypothetical protein
MLATCSPQSPIRFPRRRDDDAVGLARATASATSAAMSG